MTARNPKVEVDAYPSLAWVLVPIMLIPVGLFIRSRLAARKLARTGIGRGAPGFQTNVRRIAVTPEIAARLRAGEQVSPEEIAAATAAAAAKATSSSSSSLNPTVSGSDEKGTVGGNEKEEGSEGDENEWLPEGIRKTAHNKGGAKARKGKKRR